YSQCVFFDDDFKTQAYGGAGTKNEPMIELGSLVKEKDLSPVHANYKWPPDNYWVGAPNASESITS
ncbi:hypothetical protein HAX54_002170, partial [Datura stramonium]|nr:hypothetical protein [Datura stramonium]